MKCPKCQSENPEKAKFCVKCAAKLEIVCPSCGEASPPDSNFCMNCAHDLAVPSEQPPSALSFDEKLDKIHRVLGGGCGAPKALGFGTSDVEEPFWPLVAFREVSLYALMLG